MEIKTVSYKPAFKAKFFHSESLKQIADYAVEKGKFDKLNQSRKNIDKANLSTRLRVDIGENNGIPFVTFSRFTLKNNVIVPNSMDDYNLTKVRLISASKPQNLLKFAYEKMIKLGNNAPNNNLYKDVVVKR